VSPLPHRVAHGASLVPARAGPDGMPRPHWVEQIVQRAGEVDPSWFSRFLPPEAGFRESAVLVLFGPNPDGEESLLLIERAHGLRAHAGQVAFPGGRVDPEDEDVVAAALREAREEVDLNTSGVEIVGRLPSLYLPVSDYAVAPIIAWWRDPAPVTVGHPDEVAQVVSVPIAFLTEPDNRHTVVHSSGYRGPAWDLGGDLLLWGFTGGIIDKALELAGVARPWDSSRMLPLPPRFYGRRS
jgi:8-oxo-dGTP pyrophosphatase MutT (NUDIX family)